MPVVVHAGHAPVGTDNTGPGPFGSLMARYPDLTAIVAHLGAPDYGAFLRMAADYERVALDTTMVFTGFFDKLARLDLGEDWLARCAGTTRWRCSGYLSRSAAASSPVTRSLGRAGLRWPFRPVMSSLATSALTTASSVACTTAS